MTDEPSPAGWYSDPIEKFAFRYWDGTAWTDAGVNSTEEIRGVVVQSIRPPATGNAERPGLFSFTQKQRKRRDEERELKQSGLGFLRRYPPEDRDPIRQAIEMDLIRSDEIITPGRSLFQMVFGGGDGYTHYADLPEALSPGRRVRVWLRPTGSRPNRGRGYIPQQTKFDVLRQSGNRCVRCGSHDHLEIDHIRPIARGGTDDIRNLQVLCRRCNRSKGARY